MFADAPLSRDASQSGSVEGAVRKELPEPSVSNSTDYIVDARFMWECYVVHWRRIHALADQPIRNWHEILGIGLVMQTIRLASSQLILRENGVDKK